MPKGPDFPKDVIDTLAKRANQLCSRPSCRKPTSGPHSEDSKAVNFGEAAHIRGAREGSARYDPSMTDEERSSSANGIWLCRACAWEIDRDEKRFPVDALLSWKEEHERLVQIQGPHMYSDLHAQAELSRVQRENAELRRENEELRQRLNSKEEFQRQYELAQTPAGAWAYVPREGRNHYVYQSCWDNKGNREILCERSARYGLFECPGCKNDFRVNPSQHIPQSHARRPGNPFSRTNL